MDLGSLVNDGLREFSYFQTNYPNISSMLTAELTFVTGDFISQTFIEKKVNKRKLMYTAALAPIYGLCVNGLIETGEVVGRYISENPLTKAALGPNLWGNLFNTFFFVNNTVGEKNDYNIGQLIKNYKEIGFNNTSEKGFFQRMKDNYLDNIPPREFAYATISTLTVWNALQFVNYTYVEPNLRTTACLGAALIWTSILSLWSLNGGKKINSSQ